MQDAAPKAPDPSRSAPRCLHVTYYLDPAQPRTFRIPCRRLWLALGGLVVVAGISLLSTGTLAVLVLETKGRQALSAVLASFPPRTHVSIVVPSELPPKTEPSAAVEAPAPDITAAAVSLEPQPEPALPTLIATAEDVTPPDDADGRDSLETPEAVPVVPVAEPASPEPVLTADLPQEPAPEEAAIVLPVVAPPANEPPPPATHVAAPEQPAAPALAASAVRATDLLHVAAPVFRPGVNGLELTMILAGKGADQLLQGRYYAVASFLSYTGEQHLVTSPPDLALTSEALALTPKSGGDFKFKKRVRKDAIFQRPPGIAGVFTTVQIVVHVDGVREPLVVRLPLQTRPAGLSTTAQPGSNDDVGR